MSDVPLASVCPDTSSDSLLHRLARRRSADSKAPALAIVYLVVVAVTYLPLLIAARLGDVPLWHGDRPGQLTFFHDWGLGYALLVSLPTLVVLLVSDERILCSSLHEVQQDGVIVLSSSIADPLRATWKRYFKAWNLIAQLPGIEFGIVLGILTVRRYQRPDVDTWIAPDGQLHLAGYLYLYCIILLYTVVIIYVTRSIVVSRLLRAIVEAAPLRILPLHPDKCGGLRPVGQLGLRNQYTLTVLGINIVLLLVVWVYGLGHTAALREVMIGASVAYLILGPVIFMAPLLPFRQGMQNAKKEWTREVARVVRVEIERLRLQIGRNEITKPDEESLERLRKVGAAIDELPIWPFDASTLKKFATAYILPLALPILGESIRAFLKVIGT
jgi:hypothetical protein